MRDRQGVLRTPCNLVEHPAPLDTRHAGLRQERIQFPFGVDLRRGVSPRARHVSIHHGIRKTLFNSLFGRQEGATFATGSGVNQPRGILSYTNVANASYAWGSVGFIGTGASGAFPTATTSVSPADPLIDLYYSLKAGYRNGASWLMSDATMGAVRKLKDVDGKFVWSAPTAIGEVATVLMKPVYTDDNMSAIAANSYSIAFADFKRAYQVVDKFGIRVLRDPFTSKPNVLFYTTKRVGGGIRMAEAIKLLKMEA